MQLSINDSNLDQDPFKRAISPLKEIIAYEYLWNEWNASFKKIAELFANNPGKRPSDLVHDSRIAEFKQKVLPVISQNKPNVLINNTFDYPVKLRDAKEPVEVLYFQGNLNLLNTRCVAVVGARKVTPEGLLRTRQLVRALVKDNFTIVSGLALGVDKEAHSAAIEYGGQTIAVLGTPLNQYYPRENRDLQDKIRQDFLLLSQVPYHRYSQQTAHANKWFFPERNKTMCALTEATIIVEASDTSGTLVQARAAIDQKRKLFILESCFQNSDITWPKKFEALGAVRVKTYDDIQRELGIGGGTSPISTTQD